MLVNAEGRAFVGRRIDNKEGDWWQMPQGGVDEGEDLREAALRELGRKPAPIPRTSRSCARWRNRSATTCPKS